VTKRALLIWFHVLTSVGWMSMALALATLLIWGLTHEDPSAFRMAGVIDHELLQHLGTASAFSGFMLSALTPWGYFRYWWVLTKSVITLAQLNLGIFVLGQNLQANPGWAMVVASLLMVSAFAFQAWLSIAKPWKFTPWASRQKPPAPPGWTYLAAIAVPVADYALWKAPLLSLLIVLGYPIVRKVRAARIATA